MLGITPSHLFVYYYTFLLYKTVFFSISLCTFPCQMESKVKSLKSVLSFFSAYFFFLYPYLENVLVKPMRILPNKAIHQH